MQHHGDGDDGKGREEGEGQAPRQNEKQRATNENLNTRRGCEVVRETGDDEGAALERMLESSARAGWTLPS